MIHYNSSRNLKLLKLFIISIITYNLEEFYPALACASRGYVIGTGVHILYIIMFVDEKNNLNRTLVIDSPFQTFAVGLIVEFID